MISDSPIPGAPISGSVNYGLADLAAVLLQTVVDRGDRTDEGHLIEAVAPAWDAILEILRRDPEQMFAIPPRTWDEIIAGTYERSGFDRVTLTPRSRDAGRDVIAEKTGWGAVRFVDQVKAYKPGHLVTAEEVRALDFVLLSDQGATKGIVTTTSGFAPLISEDPLIRPYLPTRIELVDGQQLIQRLKALPRRWQ